MQKKLIIDTTRKKLDYKLGLSPITLLINIHLKQEFFQIISNIVKLFQFLKIKILFSNLTIMTLHQFYHHFLKVLKEQQSEQSKTFEGDKLLSDSQFGFHKNRNTTGEINESKSCTVSALDRSLLFSMRLISSVVT